MLYLKIINTFLKNNIASCSKFPKTLNIGIKVSVGQVVLELLIKTAFWLILSVT